jgi:hypothetical protein
MTDVLLDGKVVDHPDDQIASDWQAGKVQLIAGKSYQLRLSDGSYGHATPEHLAGALKAGASFASRDEALADAHAKEEEGRIGGLGGSLAAGAYGFASQATLGASDYLQKKIIEGEVGAIHALGFAKGTPDLAEQAKAEFSTARKEQQEYHPIATGVGEVGGAIALTAALPGVGIVGKAKTATEGANLLTRIAARTAAHAVVGGLEGAQYGVAKAISDDAIEDHALTAEHILAEVGPNALWGGALGGGLGALGSVASETLRAYRAPRQALVDALERGAGSNEDMAAVAGRAIDAPPAEGLGAKVKEYAAKISAAASGKDPEAILNVWNNRGEIAEAEAVRDQAIRDVRTHGDSILTASKDVEEVWKRGMKRSFMASQLEGVDAAEAANRARALSDHVIERLNGMIDEGGRYGGKSAVTNTLEVAHGLSHRLDEAIKAGDVGEMYGLTDDLKKAIGKPTSKAARLIPGAQADELMAMQVSERQQAWKDMYSTLQVGLEDEGTWKEMGATQKRVNRAYSALIDARQRFNSSLVTDIGRDPSDPWSRAQGIDPAKVGGYVRGLINPEKDLTHKAVREYLAGSQELSQAFKESFDLPPDKVRAVDQIASSAKAFSDSLATAEKSLVLTNQFEELRRVASGNSMTAAATIGGLAHGIGGGVVGLALGKVAKAFSHPADSIMQLARIEQMARNSDSRIVRALRGLSGEAKRSAGVDASTYARKSGQVAKLAANPQLVTDRITTNLGEMKRTAPKLADSLTMTGVAGLAFLRSKLPPVPAGDMLNPNAKPTSPPRAQQEAWLRYYEAVKDPLSVVEDLKNRRLSVEGIETLKTVYPNLYARVQAKTMDEMASGRMRDLDSQQRMGLGILLDLPLPELQPGYIQARQAAYQALGMPKPGGGAGGAPKRKIDITKTRPTTSTERVEGGQAQGG